MNRRPPDPNAMEPPIEIDRSPKRSDNSFRAETEAISNEELTLGKRMRRRRWTSAKGKRWRLERTLPNSSYAYRRKDP